MTQSGNQTKKANESKEAEVDQTYVSEMEAKLQAAQERADQLEAKLKQQAEETAGLKVRSGEKPFAPEDGGYKFEVGPSPKVAEKYPELKRVTVNAVDESEAIRWYCMTHSYPPKSGNRVDPVKIPLTADCKDPRRKQLENHKKQLAAIRRKLDSGTALSDADRKVFEANESEILGY